MPLAPVDNQGTQLYFQDSGPPPESGTYTTLVLIHGTVFHGGIFSRMLPFAAAHNVRLVLLNMRDYPKSTPFSADELAVIKGGDFDAQSALIQARGVEFASFLVWFIKAHDIPPLSVRTSADGTSEVTAGGVSFSGWSYGNTLAFSFLSHADRLSAETRDLLESYLRTYVIYDSPGYSIGLPIERLWSPLRDRSLTPEQVSEKFAEWVSGYYDYPAGILSELDSSSIDKLFAELDKSRFPMANPPPNQTPTLFRMSQEELKSAADIPGGPRSHVPLLELKEVYAANFERALASPSAAWPRLRIALLWCDMSPGDCVFAASQIAQRVKSPSWPPTARKVEVLRMVGANHFPHWDEPEACIHYFSNII